MTMTVALQKEGLTEQSADQLRLQMRQEPQVLQIVSRMDIRDQTELLSLGREPADRLSKFLRSYP